MASALRFINDPSYDETLKYLERETTDLWGKRIRGGQPKVAIEKNYKLKLISNPQALKHFIIRGRLLEVSVRGALVRCFYNMIRCNV